MTSRRRHHVEVRGMTCANCSRTVGDDGNDAPVLAAGAMALSSVSVLANSLAFRR